MCTDENGMEQFRLSIAPRSARFRSSDGQYFVVHGIDRVLERGLRVLGFEGVGILLCNVVYRVGLFG